MRATGHHRSVTLAQSGTLILLLALLFLFERGAHLVFGGLSILLLGGYHLLTDHRYTPEQIRSSGLLIFHLGLYLLLCSLLIWTTTGPEESPFWIIYSLPIAIAATNLGLLPTVATCAAAFSLYATITYFFLTSAKSVEEAPELLTFGLMLFIVGVLVQTFSEQNRRQLVQQRELNARLLEQHEALKESLERLEAAEESLRRKDRLAALGEMSAGIAHEIRNPLGIISASVQLLGNRLSAPTAGVGQLFDIIHEETTRLNGLITDFLAFGRPTRPSLQEVELAGLVRRAVEHVQGVAEQKGVTVVADLSPAPLRITVDPEMVQQVLLNLLLNALDATPSGGEVAVSLRRENDCLRLDVRDTGCGITEENRTKMFNPFFTTKEKGTGLGLTNAHHMVEAHGGEISGQSAPGKGSIFTVRLPIKED
jgi:signal transduction histidine kinase